MSPTRISFQRDALRASSKHRPEAGLSFPSWREPEEPFPLLQRDVPRGREPPQLRYLSIPHLKPWRPHEFHISKVERPLNLPHLLLSAGTRRRDHLLLQGRLLHSSRAQYGALRPRGPGLQVRVSRLELLSIRQTLSYLLICHRSRLSNVQWSRHRPLKATQIVEPDSSTRSYISIKRSCDSSLSYKMLTTYSRGTSLSTS